MNELRTEAPLTSSAFMSNGIHVATGASSGSTHLWDLRMCARAALELAAHGTNPVYAVRFQSPGADLPAVPSGATKAAAPRASLANTATLPQSQHDGTLGDVLSPVQAQPRVSLAADGIAGSQRQPRLSRVSGVTSATLRQSIIPDPVLSPIVSATPLAASGALSVPALQTPVAGARPSIAPNRIDFTATTSSSAMPSAVPATPSLATNHHPTDRPPTSTVLSLPLDFLSPVASKKLTTTPAAAEATAHEPSGSTRHATSSASIPPQYDFESAPGGGFDDNALLSPLRPSSFAVLQARESLQPPAGAIEPVRRDFGRSFAHQTSIGSVTEFAAYNGRLSMADSILSPLPGTAAAGAAAAAEATWQAPAAPAAPPTPTQVVANTAIYEPSPLFMRQPQATAPASTRATLFDNCTESTIAGTMQSLPPPPASATANTTTTAAVAEFQLDLIRNAVEESVNSLRDSLHHEIQNLHVDLVRQFEIQQQQLVAILAAMRMQQEATLRELDAVRLENERLRRLIE